MGGPARPVAPAVIGTTDHGGRRQDGAGDASGSFHRLSLVVLGLLRLGSLALAATPVASAPGPHRGVVLATFALAATTSTAVFARSVVRARVRPHLAAVDGVAALAETAAGAVGLLLLGTAMPATSTTGPDFWMLPYTVVTTVLLAVACRRVVAGLAGSLVLMAAYLVAAGPWLHTARVADPGAVAVVLNNAVSYPGFFALSAVGFQLFRLLTGEVDLLRRLIARSAAEQARLHAAQDAYRVAHDYPKAYLRELRRAERPSDDLRRWAAQFRADMLGALAADPRTRVDLADETAAVVAAFSGVMAVSLDISGLRPATDGTPVLVLAEAVRECLNNASFHGGGGAVAVTVSSSDATLTVTVADDGPGCNPARVMAAWALKQNAVHLVEAAGGAYGVESAPGRGTTVRLTFPLGAAGAAARSRP